MLVVEALDQEECVGDLEGGAGGELVEAELVHGLGVVEEESVVVGRAGVVLLLGLVVLLALDRVRDVALVGFETAVRLLAALDVVVEVALEDDQAAAQEHQQVPEGRRGAASDPLLPAPGAHQGHEPQQRDHPQGLPLQPRRGLPGA